jgi:hypothetical protein
LVFFVGGRLVGMPADHVAIAAPPVASPTISFAQRCFVGDRTGTERQRTLDDYAAPSGGHALRAINRRPSSNGI